MPQITETPGQSNLTAANSSPLAPNSSNDRNGSQTEVYAVVGAEPEIQAYAMAKYSRSALSMKESLEEISQQKAEKFLNTFYFQYGHRSIADLAHIALAIERLSMLAAIVVADEQRWDGQERSTRYQDFKTSGYFIPAFSGETLTTYRESIEKLFSEYESLSNRMFLYLAGTTPRPEEMKQDSYERTLRARAFDISRYLLPLAANTSLGEIVNARTLEGQVSRLLSHTHSEVRNLGRRLKAAALSPAHNVNHQRWRDLIEEIRQSSPDVAARAEQLLLADVRVAPTLVKYADPNPYETDTRRELRQLAAEFMGDLPPAASPVVDLLDDEPLEVELAATLIYEHCHHPYRQIREAVEAAGDAIRREIIDVGLRHRGRHDEMARTFRAGQQFRFDILMDIGAYRDLHRHRRCIQVAQDFTTRHGFETPEELKPAGAGENYRAVMQGAAEAVEKLAQSGGLEAAESSQYAIPLGFRKRTLFKMDFAEAAYIAELRTGLGGHTSYRKVAHQMYVTVAKRYPALAKYFRVTDVAQPVDLLKR
ncbi:MAG: FAD-dependent thymidylate synthase [Acidobacteriales bacterium]|nr:FAD-dependent thymidylate synthase [Terriglobales bacterium]